MGRDFGFRRSLCRLSHQRGNRGSTFGKIESGLSPQRSGQAFGQALRAFHSASANPDLSKRVGQFSKAGLELAACGNTMKSQNVALKDLLPGFVAAERGGVVRIAELQSQGYLYLRP